MDIVSKEVRSRMMAGIRREHTAPELRLRHELFKLGFRYVPHVSGLPGTPDLLFPRYAAVTFVHGCFWHRHPGCALTTTPTTNVEFWNHKFAANVSRDSDAINKTLMLGFRVAVVWECALRRAAPEAAQLLGSWLRSNESEISIG